LLSHSQIIANKVDAGTAPDTPGQPEPTITLKIRPELGELRDHHLFDPRLPLIISTQSLVQRYFDLPLNRCQRRFKQVIGLGPTNDRADIAAICSIPSLIAFEKRSTVLEIL